MRLTLMSYNIRHGLGMDNKVNLQRIADLITQIGPDIVGLNEVDVYNPRSKFTHQPKKLAQLTGYQIAFGATLNLGAIKYGNCLLSKWPIKYSFQHRLPSKKEPRGCLDGLIELPQGKLRALVTHLGLSQAERQDQFQLLKEIIGSIQVPYLLMGDFNCQVPAEIFGDLLSDTAQASSQELPFTYPSDHPQNKLDYIFCSPQFKFLAYKVINLKASDHLPVVSVVKLT